MEQQSTIKSVKIYATNFHIELDVESIHWLAIEDFNEWQEQFMGRDHWARLPHKMLPPGIVCRLTAGGDEVGQSIDIDVPLPKKKIPLELREAIYSINRWAAVKSIEVTQDTVEKHQYEMLHETQLDPSFLVRA